MRDISKLSILLCSLIIGYFFSLKISETISGKSTCIANYDGFGYYMYLPHLVEKGNLYLTPEWAQQKQNEYCDGCEAYQLSQRANGNYINIYQMGLAFIQAPSFFIGHIFAKIGGWKQDGFSIPYQLSFIFNALFFLLLGLFYLRKVLLEFSSTLVTAITIPLVLFGTNAFVTFETSIALQHLYLFSLNTFFIFYIIKFHKTEERKFLIISVLLFGLTTFIRPTQAILGIIPFFLFGFKYSWTKKFWELISLFPISAFAWNSIHIIYWFIVGGKFILLNLHIEEIVLTDPHVFDFILSFKKGWVLYSFLFLLLIPGFVLLFKKHRHFFWGIISLLFIYVWVMSSWENWWYAYSFGSRVMTDIYGILAIPIAILFNQFFKWNLIQKGIILTFLILVIPLSLLQGYQFKKGVIHGERMSKQQYIYLLARCNFENYSDYRLEMDRTSITWIDEINSLNKSSMKVEKKSIFSLKSPLQCNPNEALTIGRIKIFKNLPTDEARLTIKLRTSNSNKDLPVILRMEACNKHNVYDWRSWDISSGLPSENDLTFQYNLAHTHHSYDEIQIYLDQFGSDLILEDFEVIAEYVIRK